MDKVAILTIFNNNNNYGGILQAYALRKKVVELGYEADVLRYVNGKNPIYSSKVEQIKQYGLREIIHKVLERLRARFFQRFTHKITEERVRLFDEFRDQYFTIGGPYDDITMVSSQTKYKTYISGSDQIWNPNAVRNGFLLTMIDDNHKKIAYAASIGRSKFLEYEASVMVPFIQRYDYVSVREETACKLLKNHGVSDVHVVLDPTLLVEKEEWEKLCFPIKAHKKYVLCYFFSDSRTYRKEIEAYCKRKGMELLYIPFAKQEYTKGDSVGSGIMLTDVGPSEFLSYIHDAECVFTDSFHGTVFSLLFKTQFVVYKRDKKDNIISKNSRIYDLLNAFELTERLYSSEKGIDEYFDVKIDYKKIDNLLVETRNKSMDFLSNSLK